ncbi:unnamed protein product [Trichogramma brassicae]|uniref:Uncharacterized protein n=1 Tax=Trichogramma brassicae TaxID=86971 RepID=A0A6H5J5J2_9HYME|nr:unnamed protein product [Trichogramma brassicae]
MCALDYFAISAQYLTAINIDYLKDRLCSVVDMRTSRLGARRGSRPRKKLA